MKIMMIGDTHGHHHILGNKLVVANTLGIKWAVVLGDFGLWPGDEGVRFLDEVNAVAMREGVKIIAIPGNHEDHDQWEKWFTIAPKHFLGMAQVRSNIFLTKKVHNFSIGGKNFFVCGGAVSIDRKWRTTGKSYWPNETFSEENLGSTLKYSGPSVDYLLSHDASDYTPWGFNLVPDIESQANRRRLDRAIEHLKPNMHFHGHMHKKFEWDNKASHGLYDTGFGLSTEGWNGASTKTYGLDCDGERFSWGLLDTKENRFFWPNDPNFPRPLES